MNYSIAYTEAAAADDGLNSKGPLQLHWFTGASCKYQKGGGCNLN